jgi:hypothetical protein
MWGRPSLAQRWGRPETDLWSASAGRSKERARPLVLATWGTDPNLAETRERVVASALGGGGGGDVEQGGKTREAAGEGGGLLEGNS